MEIAGGALKTLFHFQSFWDNSHSAVNIVGKCICSEREMSLKDITQRLFPKEFNK